MTCSTRSKKKNYYKKFKPVLIDAASEARLLNRYIAYCTWRKYDDKHGIKQNHIVIAEKKWLQIQWQNIVTDLKSLYTNPFWVLPRIALSLGALFFILFHNYHDAITLSFLLDVAYDNGTGSGTNGDQANVSWSHTIASGNNGIVVSTETLNGTTSANYNSISLTNCISTGTPTSQEQAFYGVGFTSGSHTVQVHTSTSSPLCGAAVSMTNVAQTSTIGATSSATSGTSSALTTLTNGSMRLDIACIDNETASTPNATLSSGTKRATGTGGSNQFNEYTTIYTNPQATAGANTYTWTFTNINRGAFMAIEVQPVAPSGGIPNRIVNVNQTINRAATY